MTELCKCEAVIATILEYESSMKREEAEACVAESRATFWGALCDECPLREVERAE